MDDEYVGGSLKLRNFKTSQSKKKKNKAKISRSSGKEGARETTGGQIAGATSSSAQKMHKVTTHKKTAAERKFEEALRKRLPGKVAKTASLSHKERVEKFNKYLENLSEHYDIPKVGPG